ncbi:MAG: LURP-one-related family protein [Candidatus Izimaplasma sp.]|nr:LURP-one-related family protein [Candidatus Izimaplasma bacterium]
MKYYVKQKVFSLRDKFTIKDYSQNDVFQVQGKFMSLTNKLELLNMNGSQVLNSKKQLFKLFPVYRIYSNHNEELAVIKKKFSFKPKFEVILGGHDEYQVVGTLFAHTFSILKDGVTVAEIIKKVFSFGDSYEIDILDESKKELFLFIVIIIDQIIHEGEKNQGDFDI